MISAFGKARLAFLLVALLVIGVLAGRAYLYGDGIVHMMVPRGLEATFKIDGKVVPPWQDVKRRTREYSVPQGTHDIVVELSDGRVSSYKLTMANGFGYWVVPAYSDQCFVRIDVTQSRYSSGGGKAELTDRFSTRQPFEIDAGTYFSVEGLPYSRRWLSDVYLLEDLRCDRLKKTDAELLDLLGE